MKAKQTEISTRIKNLAVKLGFTDCGIAPAGLLHKDSGRLKTWLQNGMHASMQYMENHFGKRTNPSLLVPGAKSVIVVLLNYYPKKTQNENTFQIAKYAYGKDYHYVMKRMLKQLQHQISKEIIPLEGRAFVDSAPVPERALAAMAGLGWIGKNANLISPKYGSFCFLGEIIVDVELDFDKPMQDRCGSCSKCLSACPTGAILNDRRIDSRKCISYWTIEHKGTIDEDLKGTFKNQIFGCDICQDVCPWNRKVKSTSVADFQPAQDLLSITKNNWQELTEERFRELFKGSAVKRTKYVGLMRNIEFVRKKTNS